MKYNRHLNAVYIFIPIRDFLSQKYAIHVFYLLTEYTVFLMVFYYKFCAESIYFSKLSQHIFLFGYKYVRESTTGLYRAGHHKFEPKRTRYFLSVSFIFWCITSSIHSLNQSTQVNGLYFKDYHKKRNTFLEQHLVES